MTVKTNTVIWSVAEPLTDLRLSVCRTPLLLLMPPALLLLDGMSLLADVMLLHTSNTGLQMSASKHIRP